MVLSGYVAQYSSSIALLLEKRNIKQNTNLTKTPGAYVVVVKFGLWSNF
jgi:hypothetical protein